MRATPVLRKVLRGKVYKNLKFQRFMSTQENCEEKKQMNPNDCCTKKPCLMDEICHPEGSWQEGYNKQNKKDSRILYIGIASFTFTLIYLKFFQDLAKGYPEVTFF